MEPLAPPLQFQARADLAPPLPCLAEAWPRADLAEAWPETADTAHHQPHRNLALAVASLAGVSHPTADAACQLRLDVVDLAPPVPFLADVWRAPSLHWLAEVQLARSVPFPGDVQLALLLPWLAEVHRALAVLFLADVQLAPPLPFLADVQRAPLLPVPADDQLAPHLHRLAEVNLAHDLTFLAGTSVAQPVSYLADLTIPLWRQNGAGALPARPGSAAKHPKPRLLVAARLAAVETPPALFRQLAAWARLGRSAEGPCLRRADQMLCLSSLLVWGWTE